MYLIKKLSIHLKGITKKGVFSEVVGGKRRGQQEDGDERPKTKIKRQSGKDEEYYIPYRPKDFDSERGSSLGGEGSAFEQQASSDVLDLMGDEGDRLNQQKKMMKWDRKKKRFVRETGKEDQKKKIKTDSGQVISNKKNRKNFYEEWKKKYKIDDKGSGSDGETGGGGRKPARALQAITSNLFVVSCLSHVVAMADEVQTYSAPVTTKHARS
ncbi:ATP-dependent RNA helicase DDX54-like [Oreochromis niloticus]|uniref:ATP-dependent RNA helicase DDX54-like n=1 Tax=Oreochromis niloticus TaxID=8128 RepID=UPI000DF2D46A|nr:ATP-dependent RNA helicase DDX54-like [Oreochromis niloticus]